MQRCGGEASFNLGRAVADFAHTCGRGPAFVRAHGRSTNGHTGRRLGYVGCVARVLSIVLAGGEGKRLLPLTLDRAKPAVPFGGHYRLIDFALSNLANAGFTQVMVLTQYKSHSLDLHITRTWRFSTLLGSYVTPVPAQMRRGPWWFSGSADAIYQNLNIIGDERPQYILVFGADHIYRMDPRQMLIQHIETGAAATVAAIRVPPEQASGFGIIEPGERTVIERFVEKPPTPWRWRPAESTCSRRWAITFSRWRPSWTRCARMLRTPIAATIWVATSSPGLSRAATPISTISYTERGPRRQRARARLLE